MARSHGLIRGGVISSFLIDQGFSHEANQFIPTQSKVGIQPYEQPLGLIQLTSRWGDYSHLSHIARISPKDFLSYSGLKIMNFHPIHLFLNTLDIETYSKAKIYTKRYDLLHPFVNKSDKGIRDFFTDVVHLALEQKVNFGLLRDITVHPP